MELENPGNGEATDFDSTCSTPYVSAPSSPGRGFGHGSYFFSAPASPMHFVLSSPPYSAAAANHSACSDVSVSGSFEFDFLARYPVAGAAAAAGSMISADELFLNGQIRPMKLSSHLQRPQALAPLIDVDAEDEEDEEGTDVAVVRGRDLRMRSRSMHRRARSMSPLRNSRFQWQDEEDVKEKMKDLELKFEPNPAEDAATPSGSASSSRSSSSGRNSKRWIFLMDLLYRSKSEGRRTSGKEKFWHALSFSPSSSKHKSKSKLPPPSSSHSPPAPTSEPPPKQRSRSKKTISGSSSSRPTNGVGKRRAPAPSPHERHYTANRAVAEEMRKRTFLPYRQGLLGCLGFSSRSYGAVNGFARAFNPVSIS